MYVYVLLPAAEWTVLQSGLYWLVGNQELWWTHYLDSLSLSLTKGITTDNNKWMTNTEVSHKAQKQVFSQELHP